MELSTVGSKDRVKPERKTAAVWSMMSSKKWVRSRTALYLERVLNRLRLDVADNHDGLTWE